MKTSSITQIALYLSLATALVQTTGATPHRPLTIGEPVPSLGQENRRLRAGQFGGGFGAASEDVELRDRFDKDGNKRLDAEERRAARAEAETLGLNRGRGGRRGGGANATPPQPGIRIAPESVRPYPSTPLYDTGTLRTLFLDFENDQWEQELMAFKRTDVDVPASMTVDGRKYEDVGVQFHGNSSFSSVPLGLKHSMRLDLEFVHKNQDVRSYNTLLLLNGHDDPSLLHTVLYMEIARHYGPAPAANFVRVVINGENWGIYVNQQQFDKDLINDAFGTREGTRWKVPGSPGNRSSGLSYLGDDPASYKQAYEIKTNDDPKAWAALVNLTRVLDRTPPDRLEAALAPLMDVDETLKFLAVDNALANGDGYWTRGSDYSLFLDPAGRFHILPYDTNSSFPRAGGGGGRGGGGRGGSVDLSPLVAANDPGKPLASKLLAVPAFRSRYLAYVRDIANTWLDWSKLDPVVTRYHSLIAADVQRDTRKLGSFEAFQAGREALKSFADSRRAFLLAATAVPTE